MLGAGHLVQEMLPWISGEDSSHIEILTRDTQKAKTIFPLIQVKNLYFSSASHQALVIAAPVSDQQILEILRSSPQTRLVFDFRGEDNSLAQMLDDRFFYKGLGQFFDDLKEIQNQTIQLVQMVKQEIKNLVNQYHSRLEHRPMGWDDLCA